MLDLIMYAILLLHRVIGNQAFGEVRLHDCIFNEVSNDIYSVKLANMCFLLFHKFLGEPFILEVNTNNVSYDVLNDNDEIDWLKSQYTFEDYERYVKRFIHSYKGPKVLDLCISELCNLNCHMCFYSINSQRTLLKTKLMPFSLAKEWIDFYVDQWSEELGIDLLSFHFGAAEPLMNKETLIKAIDYINQRTEKNKEILINTNLTLANKFLLDYFIENKVKISVGLDGLFEANDVIRGTGTFKRIVNNLSYLIERGNKPGVNLTLTSKNFNKVNPIEFLKFMKDLGIEAVLVDVDMIKAIPLEPKDIVDLLMQFQIQGDEIGIEIRGNWKAPFFNLITERDEIEPKTFCSSLRGKNLVVTSQGNLTFCTYASKMIVKPKNIYDVKTNFIDFIKNIKKFMFSNFDRINMQCRNCPIMSFCNGGCFLTLERGGKLDTFCAIYRLATYELIKYNLNEEGYNEKAKEKSEN